MANKIRTHALNLKVLDWVQRKNWRGFRKPVALNKIYAHGIKELKDALCKRAATAYCNSQRIDVCLFKHALEHLLARVNSKKLPYKVGNIHQEAHYSVDKGTLFLDSLYNSSSKLVE